jgi:shikimate dehydrogenase
VARTRALPVTLCGSLSRLAGPLGRSVHEAGYRALGLAFTYVPFEVSDLAGAIAGMRALGIRGLGVSQPYKQQVMPLLDALDPLAERIGAVNTIVNDDGHLVGHNTDCTGAVRALEEVRPLDGARVLLVGAGGAARAIAFGLQARGARTTIMNRDRARAESLAAEVGAQTAPFEPAERARRAGDHDIIVNATSIGQAAGAGVEADSAVPEEALGEDHLVMDIVYKPLQTPLIESARRRGAQVIQGDRMLFHQATAQFELYTQRPAPLAAMHEALRRAMEA